MRIVALLILGVCASTAKAHDPELDRCFTGPEFERFHESQLALNDSMGRFEPGDDDWAWEHATVLQDFLISLDGRWACLLEGPCAGEECGSDVVSSGQHNPYTVLDECFGAQDRMTRHMLETLNDMYGFATLLGNTLKSENPYIPTIIGSNDRDALVIEWKNFANMLGDGFGLQRAYDECLQNALAR